MIAATDIKNALEQQPEEMKSAEQTMQRLLARSATDRAFRHTLVTNPRAALAEYIGRDIADVGEFNVVFVENKAAATVVLPPAVDPAAELSAEELEAVAGGITPVIVTVLSIIASALALYRAIMS